MARPKIDEKSQRKIQYKILLNDEENKIFQEKLKKSIHRTMADMLREVILKNQYITVTSDENMFEVRTEILNEVRRVGNNFNQLLKHFNQKKSDSFNKNDLENIVFLLQNIKENFNDINTHFKL